MLLPRVFAPARAAFELCSATFIPSTRVLNALRPASASPALSFIRHASHQAQGRANGAKDGPGKRLGAKKAGGEYVIPGNIIFRQRGVSWYPGENCKMGRDHCIFAMESGYVRYYKDPLKHPDRQYIGIVFDKEQKLPTPPNAARRRRLNMLPQPRTDIVEGEVAVSETGEVVAVDAFAPAVKSKRPGYATRKTNYEIGRMGDEVAKTVKQFIPGDRFTAWRKSAARMKLNVERKKLRNAQKASKPKAKPKRRG